MTPDEQARMNELCAQIQKEKDYKKFEELMRNVTALMAAKKSRFPESKLAPAGTGQTTLHATAVRTIRRPEGQFIEVHVAEAEPLYSEIRIANSFTDEQGKELALQTPAPLDLKLQAPAHRFMVRSPGDKNA